MSRIVLAAVAVFALLALPSIAKAQVGAVLVTGKASDHDRKVVADAATQAVVNASWSVVPGGFEPQAIEAIVKCMPLERPWSCIKPHLGAREIDRLVVVQVEPARPRTRSAPSITAQLVLADDRVPPEEHRFCEPKCTEAVLIDTTNLVMAALLKRAQPETHTDTRPPRATGATLTVRSDPPGAMILVDGRRVGTAGEPLALTPGQHSVEIVLAGYRRERRTISAIDGQPVGMDVVLHRESPRSSRVLPIAVIAAGGLLTTGCLVYQFTRDPPDTYEQPRFLTSWPAIGGAVVGAATVGFGIYLLRREHNQQSTPTAALVPGGAVIGWARSFD